jgi:V8-like Glu-specific endopeptidase
MNQTDAILNGKRSNAGHLVGVAGMILRTFLLAFGGSIPGLHVAVFTSLTGAMACAPAAHANVFVEDRRRQHDSTLPIFRSVGLLYHPEAGAGGTAFLVGNCHIVTAYHVAFMKERNAVTGNVETIRGRRGHAAEFLIGPDPDVPARFASMTRATVVDFGKFSKADFHGMAGDWAILKLDDCLGKKYGFLKYARPFSNSSMPEGELMTVGFPKSRASLAGITVERGCKARDHGPVAGLVGVDCAFESGMSGGPVLEQQTDRGWLVVGLIQQSMAGVEEVLPSYSMAHRNQVVYVTAFWKALDKALRQEGKRVLADRTRLATKGSRTSGFASPICTKT